MLHLLLAKKNTHEKKAEKRVSRLIKNKKYASIFSLIVVAGILFSIFFFSFLTGWVLDRAEYKLFVNAKGNVDNLTVTSYICFFNASTGSISHP